MEKGKKLIGVLVLLIMVLTLTVGYSYLSASLNINGTSKIKTTTWDIHFNNINVTTGSVTATEEPTIDGSGLNITYEVELDTPGDRKSVV